MALKLTGKVFTITGGASGMGAATAKLLAQRCASAICIADRQMTPFAALREEINKINPETKVMATELDVTSSYAVAHWVDRVVTSFGRLDGCANVAGVAQPVGQRQRPTILEETDETWKRTMGVNIDGVMYCTREQIRAMLKLPREPRTIVNVSSMASLIHTPDAYAYSASKRSCASFSTSVSKDVHDFGIRVNTVSPGATLTPMMGQFFKDEVRDAALDGLGMDLLEPSDIARAIVYLLTEDSAKITGANLPVGLGLP
ncbi:short chain dehydrogenase/oxidoreductase CpoX2 [Aspergillus sergii]|uniref:Short chain dehydrogenase/oxidoreductase CpoX2 n=1 Tax=Aspergillus sergii TaxID=1034303 RepID=A0A5N6XDV8_9EURO|nr:short chain dehydrogenase/oxidoreductase CpoX2 [Aspergillus sergii]